MENKNDNAYLKYFNNEGDDVSNKKTQTRSKKFNQEKDDSSNQIARTASTTKEKENDIRRMSSNNLSKANFTEDERLKKTIKSGLGPCASNRNINQDQCINTTILQLVNDIKDPNKSAILNYNNYDCASIYLPINTIDLDEELRLAEAGYMEEDDDDLKSSGFSGGFFGIEEEDPDFRKIIKVETLNDNSHNKSKDDEDNVKSLESKAELERVLFPKTQYEVNPNQTYSIKTIKLVSAVEVVDQDMFLVILNYLYSELHNGLLELSDNFIEERRKYFIKNFDTYLTIVNYYLKSKEEFFLGVLSQIMSKLSITQCLLDHSFSYYMNEAESSPQVEAIRAAYEKVYKAGEKYSIAPKIITKIRLKGILDFQLKAFEEYHSKYPELTSEVLEIIVIDKVYAEYGFDKEAIRAAIAKHHVFHDDSLDGVLSRLDEYRSNSFLNI